MKTLVRLVLASLLAHCRAPFCKSVGSLPTRIEIKRCCRSPEHDLERRQRKQCNPNLRIQESFHGSLFVVGLNDVEWRSRRFSELGDLRRSSREIRSTSRIRLHSVVLSKRSNLSLSHKIG